MTFLINAHQMLMEDCRNYDVRRDKDRRDRKGGEERERDQKIQLLQ